MARAPRMSEPEAGPQATPGSVRPIDPDRSLVDMAAAVGRIETLAELSKDRFDRFETKLDAKLDALEAKVSKLENWRSWMIGGFAVLAIVISLASALLSWVVNKAIDVYVETNKAPISATAPSQDGK